MARGRGRRHGRIWPAYHSTRPVAQANSHKADEEEEMCAETLIRNHSNAWNVQYPASNGLDQEIEETSNSPLNAPAVSHRKSRKKNDTSSQHSATFSSARTQEDSTSSATLPASTAIDRHNNSPAAPLFSSPGLIWLGDKYYALPERLSKIKQTAESWSSHNSSSASSAGDVAISANAGDLEAANTPSAFPSSPAMPPGAYLATMRTGAASLGNMPRNCAASSVTSAQYRKAILQRHLSSFKFFSRDNLLEQSITDADGIVSYVPRTLLGAHVQDSTGALLWVQSTQQKYIRPFAVDLGGRTRHRQGDMRGYNPRVETFRNVPESEMESFHWQQVTNATNNPHPLATVVEQQTSRFAQDTRHTRNLAFTSASESTGLRGLETFNFTRLGALGSAYGDDDDDEDDIAGHSLVWQTALVKPNAHWTSRDSSFNHHLRVLSAEHVSLAAVNSMDYECIVSVIRRETDKGAKVDGIVIAPSLIGRVPCPRFHQTAYPPNNVCHTAICLNKGTGYCWVGFRSGSVQVIDALHLLKIRHGSASSQNLRYRPTVAVTPFEKAVTSLVAVGDSEAIVAYSDGSLARLRKPPSASPAYVVIQYHGHVNAGDMSTVMCADAKSRLIAVRGMDKHIRIWHFDEPYPLNTAWHQTRKPYTSSEVDLLAPYVPQQHKISKRMMADARAEAVPDPQEEMFKDLAESPLPDATSGSIPCRLQSAVRAPLADLAGRNVACMSFVHTSWIADRDQQWEHAREFGPDDRPNQLLQMGPLPALCVGVNTEKEPRLLYFEPISESRT